MQNCQAASFINVNIYWFSSVDFGPLVGQNKTFDCVTKGICEILMPILNYSLTFK